MIGPFSAVKRMRNELSVCSYAIASSCSQILRALLKYSFLDLCCIKSTEQSVPGFELFFILLQLSVIMFRWPDFLRRPTVRWARCRYPRESLDDGPLLIWRMYSPDLWTRTALTHLSNWSCVDLSCSPRRDGGDIIHSPAQLSVGAYHACLTGGSCQAVCDKRLKHWTLEPQ